MVTRSMAEAPSVLIIVQNLSVPFDRRVWSECLTLAGAGYQVGVVCPGEPGAAPHEIVEGVEIHRYRPWAPGRGPASYVLEYAYSFLATSWLLARIVRRSRVDVLQCCNPPDIFWPLGLLLRRWRGTRFVFDHHDVCPELFQSRFPDGPEMVRSALCLLERMTFRTADHVISTNGSYAAIAMERGRVDPARITIVRSGPDPSRLHLVPVDPTLRRGRRHLVAYLGVMGPQDGVDLVLDVADRVVHGLGRDDIAFTLMGSGDCYESLVRRRDALGLAGAVELTGRISDDDVAAVLSAATVGICPDPKSPLNDVSTMNKTMEYMAFGLPVVAFDLFETRVSAGDAALYVAPSSAVEMAHTLVALVDDPSRCRAMGTIGRARVEAELSWGRQAPRYLEVFDMLTGTQRPAQRAPVEVE